MTLSLCPLPRFSNRRRARARAGAQGGRRLAAVAAFAAAPIEIPLRREKLGLEPSAMRFTFDEARERAYLTRDYTPEAVAGRVILPGKTLHYVAVRVRVLRGFCAPLRLAIDGRTRAGEHPVGTLTVAPALSGGKP